MIRLLKPQLLQQADLQLCRMVWGFKDHSAPSVLQNPIHRFYLGVLRFAGVTGTGIEMDQPLIRMVRQLGMLKYHNRILKLNEDRWPKIICNYVCYICTYVCTYISMYLCIYISMYLCTYLCSYVCTCVCIHLCIYVCPSLTHKYTLRHIVHSSFVFHVRSHDLKFFLIFQTP